MTNKIRQAAVECARECGIYGITERIGELAEHIERAMRKLMDAQPVESRHVPTLTFGAGEFSCAVCGLGMEKPCEHWKQMELVKALKGFTTDDGTWMQGAMSEILFAIRAYVAERVKEAERQARLGEAKIWRPLKADLRPDSLFIEWADERIAELEAKR